MKIFAALTSFLFLKMATAKNINPWMSQQEGSVSTDHIGKGRELDHDLTNYTDYTYFLVSHVDLESSWCLTVVDGNVALGGEYDIMLRPCDFENAPPNQLWFPFNDEIYSALGDFYTCLTLGDDNRARIDNTGYYCGQFIYDGTSEIRIKEQDDLCLTNRGPKPHASDPVSAKDCKHRPDFYWEAIPSFASHVTLVSPSSLSVSLDGGCAQPRVTTTRVYLDSCGLLGDWRIEFRQGLGDKVLLHSASNDDLCLRAGQGRSYEDGSSMRISPCDVKDTQQHIRFEFTKPGSVTIHVSDDLSLCMVFRGLNVNIGVDPIILKTCDGSEDDLWIPLVDFL